MRDAGKPENLIYYIQNKYFVMNDENEWIYLLWIKHFWWQLIFIRNTYTRKWKHTYQYIIFIIIIVYFSYICMYNIICLFSIITKPSSHIAIRGVSRMGSLIFMWMRWDDGGTYMLTTIMNLYIIILILWNESYFSFSDAIITTFTRWWPYLWFIFD